MAESKNNPEVQAHIDHLADLYKISPTKATQMAVDRGIIVRDDDGSFKDNIQAARRVRNRKNRSLMDEPTEDHAPKRQAYPGMNKNEAKLMPYVEEER